MRGDRKDSKKEKKEKKTTSLKDETKKTECYWRR